MKYILDSCAFDYLLDNSISTDRVSSAGSIFVASITHDELTNTPDSDRRAKLLTLFDELDPTIEYIAPPVWDDSLYWHDETPWREESSPVEDLIYGSSTNNSKRRDAAIGEAANGVGRTLVTTDNRLLRRARIAGVKTLHPDELFALRLEIAKLTKLYKMSVI